MAQLIAPGPADNAKIIEDKTRALAANQGLNDNDMWVKIDTEIDSARTASKIVENLIYVTTSKLSNKHGNK